jgi:hypothetical protein
MGADIPMLEPKEITEAINTVLEYTPQVVHKLGNEDVSKLGYKELTYEQRVRWFVNNYYETGMEYASMLESMKNEDLDNFEWYGEKIQIPKFYRGVVNQNTEEQVTDDNLEKLGKKYAKLINTNKNIKVTIKKDTEAAKFVDNMKTEKQAFKETVESGKATETLYIEEDIENLLSYYTDDAPASYIKRDYKKYLQFIKSPNTKNIKNSISFLLGELLKNKLLALRYDKDNVMNEIIAKANEIHKQEQYDLKAYWFGRGILAGRENRIEELSPKKD